MKYIFYQYGWLYKNKKVLKDSSVVQTLNRLNVKNVQHKKTVYFRYILIFKQAKLYKIYNTRQHFQY